MIRSNILARRIANAHFTAAPLAASSLAAPASSSSSSSSFAADALVARYASTNGGASAPSSSSSSSVIVPPNNSSANGVFSNRRLFSSDVSVATRLGSVLQREINEETEASAEYEGGVPPELAELRSAISSKWTIIEGLSGIGDSSGGEKKTGSGASVRMIRKKAGSKGATIGIVFYISAMWVSSKVRIQSPLAASSAPVQTLGPVRAVRVMAGSLMVAGAERAGAGKSTPVARRHGT